MGEEELPELGAVAKPMTPADTPYPPEPWRLTGELCASAWLVSQDEVAFSPPPGWSPVRIGGRLMVGAVWADYRPPGVLAYRELAVGFLVRRGARVAVTLPWIWVDSPASLAGGRQMWAIPKELAEFDGRLGEACGMSASGAAAQMTYRPGGPPAPVPLRLLLAQARGGEVVLTPARAAAVLAFGRARWRASGALAFLDGRKPLISLRLKGARMVFGPAAKALR